MRRNLLLLFATIGFTLLICEALIRMIGYERTTITPLTGFHEYDSQLGWKLIPNYESRFVHRDFNVEIKTNSDGFRDDEYDLEKPDNVTRVVSLGDSFTWGWGVENDEVYMQVAENLLDEFEIINMGQNGYSTGQEFLLLKHAGKAYSPDLVTLGFVNNDLEDNISGRGKPVFDVVDGDLKMTKPPQSQTLELRLKSILVKNSNLFVLVNYGYERIRRWLKQSPQPPENRRAALAPSKYSKNPDAGAEKRWQVFDRIIVELKKEANGNLMIIYIPARGEVELSREQYVELRNNADYDIDTMRRRVEQISAENGVLFLDLTEILRDKYIAGEKLYFEHDGHMTKLGHLRAGEALAEKLKSLPDLRRVSSRQPFNWPG